MSFAASSMKSWNSLDRLSQSTWKQQTATGSMSSESLWSKEAHRTPSQRWIVFSTWWTKPQGEDRTFLLTAEEVSDVLQLSPAAGCFDSVISKITARSLTGSGHSDHPKQLRRGSRLSLSQDSNSGPKEVKIEPTAKPTRPRFNGG